MYEKEINKRAIKKWIGEAVESKSYKQYDHLHLDSVSKIFSKKTFAWIKGAFEFFEISEKIMEQFKAPCYLALCFSLKDKKEKRGFNVDSNKSLYKELDSTPPLIYIFEKGQIRWGKKPYKMTNWIPAEMGLGKMKAYYSEWKNEGDHEFNRSYLLVKIC